MPLSPGWMALAWMAPRSFFRGTRHCFLVFTYVSEYLRSSPPLLLFFVFLFFSILQEWVSHRGEKVTCAHLDSFVTSIRLFVVRFAFRTSIHFE